MKTKSVSINRTLFLSLVTLLFAADHVFAAWTINVGDQLTLAPWVQVFSRSAGNCDPLCPLGLDSDWGRLM